jgi:hypothetical protein
MHLIPAVAQIASIGIVPSLNVGGIYTPVNQWHCLLKFRSGRARRFAMQPVYTFSLKSLRRIISELVAFQTTSCAINWSKNIIQAGLRSPLASKYCSCCSLMVVPAEFVVLVSEG